MIKKQQKTFREQWAKRTELNWNQTAKQCSTDPTTHNNKTKHREKEIGKANSIDFSL